MRTITRLIINDLTASLCSKTDKDLVKVLTVNASAAEIIRLYCDGLDIDAIAGSLHQKYGVPEEQVRADVEAILKKLE